MNSCFQWSLKLLNCLFLGFRSHSVNRQFWDQTDPHDLNTRLVPNSDFTLEDLNNFPNCPHSMCHFCFNSKFTFFSTFCRKLFFLVSDLAVVSSTEFLSCANDHQVTISTVGIHIQWRSEILTTVGIWNPNYSGDLKTRHLNTGIIRKQAFWCPVFKCHLKTGPFHSQTHLTIPILFKIQTFWRLDFKWSGF